jgi:hypothetical protein
MSKNPKNEPSAKQQAIAAREEKAYQLIENGIQHSIATRSIQVEFGVGRSTAYNTVQEAQLRFEASQGNNPEISTPEPMEPTEMLALFEYQLKEAFAAGDLKAMSDMFKCIEKLKRMSAPCQTKASPTDTEFLDPSKTSVSVSSEARNAANNDEIRSSVISGDRDRVALTAIQQKKQARELDQRERDLAAREASLGM